MAKISYQYLRDRPGKGGIVKYYWEPSKLLAAAGWKFVELGTIRAVALQKCEERNAEVALWKAGGGKKLEAVKPRQQCGTVSSLIERYRREVVQAKDTMTGKPRLSPATAEGYETGLKRIEIWAGKHLLSYVTPERIGVLRDTNARPRAEGGLGHAATLNLLKTLRQLFAFAERVVLIPKGTNPATKFGLGDIAARWQVWEADDEGAFIAAAYALGMPSMALAIELALYTAQREDDLISWTEHQIKRLEIYDPAIVARMGDAKGVVMGWVLKQGKTKMPMEIALEPEILAKVDAAIRANRARDRAADPKRLLTYVLINDATGRPWDKRSFIKTYRKIIEHAATAANRPGMRDLVWHDLRRTRVVRMRRRGRHPATIAALTGHTLQSLNMMLSVYGPIDATSTAGAIASMLDALPDCPSEQPNLTRNG
jgi:hypothetical protein